MWYWSKWNRVVPCAFLFADFEIDLLTSFKYFHCERVWVEAYVNSSTCFSITIWTLQSIALDCKIRRMFRQVFICAFPLSPFIPLWIQTFFFDGIFLVALINPLCVLFYKKKRKKNFCVQQKKDQTEQFENSTFAEWQQQFHRFPCIAWAPKNKINSMWKLLRKALGFIQSYNLL